MSVSIFPRHPTNVRRRYDTCFLKWYSESMFFEAPNCGRHKAKKKQNIFEGKKGTTMSVQKCSKNTKHVSR